MPPRSLSIDSDHSLDFDFTVPHKHRLRVTQDVTGIDFEVLVDLLEGTQADDGEGSRARVLLVGESALASQVKELESQLRDCPRIDLVAPAKMVTGGESIKNSEVALRELLEGIHDQGLDRRSYVVAVGGGAMLDAVGFAAAIAHRGIRLIRLPSTVLAQADSGVGVKNAINYFGKKNWIGSFAVPWAVINDAALLKTLPDRDFVSGFSEAVKVSLLKSADDFHWLYENAETIRSRDPDVAGQAIHRSCLWHIHHITGGGDPFEMQEARPLDFGHWSAHRLEPLAEYTIRHGEAVGIGVAIDSLYSSMQFGFPQQDAIRVCDCLKNLGMNLWHESLHPVNRLLEGLEEFRQHLGGRLTITMLRGIGDPINVHSIDTNVMKQAIEQLHAISQQP